MQLFQELKHTDTGLNGRSEGCHLTRTLGTRLILHMDTLTIVHIGTQELIQSDPHQGPNTKGKDRQIQ